MDKLKERFAKGIYTDWNQDGEISWEDLPKHRKDCYRGWVDTEILTLISQHIPEDKAAKEMRPDSIHLKLIEWKGKPAIEFDDGDVFLQSQSIGELLMHLGILMPDCELPDDIYITPTLFERPKVKLPPNPHSDAIHLAAGIYDGLRRRAVEEYIQQFKEALEKAGVEWE